MKNLKMWFLMVFLIALSIFVIQERNSYLTNKIIRVPTFEGEGIPLTIQDKIEVAKKVWKIERLYKDGRSLELEKFKKDRSKNIRRFTVWLTRTNRSKFIPMEREEAYRKVKDKTQKMKIDEKKKFLINQLLEWDCSQDSLCVMQFEAAAISLIEIGKDVIPSALKIIEDMSNIPTTEPPPWNKTHTVFDIILKILMGVPDNRSIAKLEAFSKSNVKYVSEQAKEALKWINSGVPYPLKYERIIFVAEDDILPAGNDF